MLKIDFINDFKEIMVDNLVELEDVNKEEINTQNLNSLAMRFFNCSRKSILFLQKNKIKYCNPIENKINSLPKEEKEYFEKIKSYLESGDCRVKHYLSKESRNGNKQDRMLIDYGIYHFHIGKEQINQHQFSKRSDYLLFVFFEKDTVYLIDIRKHNESNLFRKKEILEILDKDYPDVLEKHNLKGSFDIRYTDEDFIKLKKTNFNLVTPINNKNIISVNMGVSTAGTCIGDKMQANYHISMLKIAENNIRKSTDLSKKFIYYKVFKFYNNKLYINKYENYIFKKNVIYDLDSKKIVEINNERNYIR